MDVDAVAAEVAAAVGLAEGPAGVADILRVIARREPVSTRELARGTQLPVPIIAAVCNELRGRGVVDSSRPARLTTAGRESVVMAGWATGEVVTGAVALAAGASAGEGEGEGGLPPELAALAPELAAVAAAAPGARMELDQSHCTVATKLRRVLGLSQAGALAGRRLLLLGDDDLVSVAVATVAGALGAPARPRRLTVVDCDPELAGFLRARLAERDLAADVIEHDLRQPLPPALRGAFDVVCTDPPYTLAGARLFLSRAVSALAPGGGGHVFFSYGARRPEETLAAQRALADMGLVTRSLSAGFNTYKGAGQLAGTSNLYHLRSTPGSTPEIAGEFDGPLYTASARPGATRPYRCAACGATHQVGPSTIWPAIADLQAAGCPDCGGTTFRPRPRHTPAEHAARAAGERLAAVGERAADSTGTVGAGRQAAGGSAAGAGVVVRPAAESDLDAIAAFEVDIARVSFGAEAIEDPAFHRRRVAAAVGKPEEVALVACRPPGAAVLGWAWLSGRTNALTHEGYGNFRSLATADAPGRGEVAQALMRAVLAAAVAAGYSRVTGKVHAANLGMRTLYAEFGFRAAHLTMDADPAVAPGGRPGEGTP